jgi:hypothetical protein
MKRLLAATLIISLAAATVVPPAVHAAEKQAVKPQKTIKLFGQIDELSYLTSSAGIKLSSSKLPAKVLKISLGSSGSYSGIREGDELTDVKIDDDNLTLTINRNGKRYQANVATDVTGLKKEFETRKIKWSLGDAAYDKELQKLTQCELVLMIDKSASMLDNHAGVPGDQTKWIWCKQQVDNFYFSTARFFDKGFDLVTFGDHSQRWHNVSLWDLKMVFDRFKPEGTRKDIATPLNEVLTDYLHARKPDSKPLLVIVLTDGMKNEGAPLQSVLAEASQKMTRPREITVVFMQVGDSVFANDLFLDLDRNLQAKGAKYDIAEYMPFEELRNKGVLWNLLTTVKDIESSGAMAKSTQRDPRI